MLCRLALQLLFREYWGWAHPLGTESQRMTIGCAKVSVTKIQRQHLVLERKLHQSYSPREFRRRQSFLQCRGCTYTVLGFLTKKSISDPKTPILIIKAPRLQYLYRSLIVALLDPFSLRPLHYDLSRTGLNSSILTTTN